MRLSKNSLLAILLILSTLPVLFISISRYHDWGDDFALYINQTRHFILNESIDHSSDIKHVGSGFSLLLVPVYYFFGNNIQAFLICISIIFFIFLQVLFVFYSNYFPKIISFLLVLFIAYNYHLLRIKAEVMYVFPLMLLLYLCFLLYKKKGMTSLILLSVCMGLLTSLATSGWIFYLIVLSYSIIQITKDIVKKSFRKRNLMIILLFTIIPLAINIIIKVITYGRIPNDDLTIYAGDFHFKNITPILSENFTYYLATFKLFFEQEVWGWANILIKDSVLVLFLIGIINKFRKEFDITDAFFIVYMATLLCYDCRSAGIRYLIPVLPIFMIYVIKGIKSIQLFIPLKENQIINLFIIILIASNFINVKNIITTEKDKRYGPQSESAVETFDFIKYNLPEKATVAFFKPYTINLYAERPAMMYMLKDSIPVLKSNLAENKVEYVLVCNDSLQGEVYDKNFSKNIGRDKEFEEVWKNQSFVLLKY